ncbi:MAG: MBL fold metallo-hydrolase [Eubacteriales bacterium]|nr:MBL fold metallo-hydrolase [Eubacteriales bacterium]
MKIFHSRLIGRNTYLIQGGEDGCDCFLLAGAGEAVMIDAGQDTHDIRKYAERLCGLPVHAVINTHSHFDHTGGNGFFDRVYITKAASASAKNTIGCGDPADYPMDYEFSYIEDGDVLEFGGRRLQIIELDCHSQGNIAVLDLSERLLFSGDEIDSGQVLLLPGFGEKPGELYARDASTVETFLRTVRRLQAVRGQFDYIMPGHNGAPVDKCYLDMFEQLAQRIMDGYEGDIDLSSPTFQSSFSHYPSPEMNYRRGEYELASLVYCKDRVYDSDPDHLEYLLKVAVQEPR